MALRHRRRAFVNQAQGLDRPANAFLYMGLFDIFKRKKSPEDRLKNMPEAMRKAYIAMFPKGVADHDRQLDELCKHFGNKYERQVLDSNLIFILTGYLITGDSKTKDNTISKVLTRPNNKLTKADADYIYNFALQNHPKLAQLLIAQEAMDILSSDGCTTDTIPGGIGRFGYSHDNPIPTNGVNGSYDYLEHLRDSKGNKIAYKRLGSTFSNVSDNPVDVYVITSPIITFPIKLCISAYQKRNSTLSPSDFVLVDDNDIVISNGGTQYGIGQRCVPNRPPDPKLVAINYFGIIDSKELSKFPLEIQEAENLNRRGFIKSNNGETEEAIKLLKEAVAKGSANAINSLFAVLHSADRFQEAHKFLIECAESGHWSAALFYNLAVIAGGYDSRYPAKFNYEKVMYFLRRCIEQLDDGMEEYRSRIQDTAQKLLDTLFDEYELP